MSTLTNNKKEKFLIYLVGKIVLAAILKKKKFIILLC